MGRPKKSTTLSKAAKVIDRLVEDEQIEAGELSPVEEGGETARPKMTDEGWTDWILDKLRDSEKDAEGNPRVNGLRRLVEDYIGDIVGSVPRIVEGASVDNGMRATAEHHVTINWNFNSDDRRTFGAAADCYSGNTEDNFARHAAATADTRAESRALRKALKLVSVITAEEFTQIPVTESGLDSMITDSQIKAINKLCKDLDIDVISFINSKSNAYAHFTHIPFKNALGMLEQINVYLRNPTKIPDNIKGYDPHWRNPTKKEG